MMIMTSGPKSEMWYYHDYEEKHHREQISPELMKHAVFIREKRRWNSRVYIPIILHNI